MHLSFPALSSTATTITRATPWRRLALRLLPPHAHCFCGRAKFLEECFVDTGDLELLQDCTRPERIVLGRTGTGKTALLLRLLQVEPRAIAIKPESLALSFISNSTVIRFFEDVGVNLETFYKLIWRHAFCVELIRMRFGVLPGQGKVSFIEKCKVFFKGDKYSSAIDYLETWGDRFWEETEHRIKEITTKVEKSLKGSLHGSLSTISLSAEGVKSLSEETKGELVRRGQMVVNDAHVPQLNQLLDLVHEVLDDPQKKYFLVIDRLDESWIEENLRYKLIMSLIDTVKDFRRVGRAKIVISLRLDLLRRVFAMARTSGFQEEKFQSLYLRMRWTKERLEELTNTRVNHMFKDRYSEKRLLTYGDVLIPTKGQLPPFEYMLSRTFYRPRDVISFFNLCISAAEGKPRIGFKDIRLAELDYSRGRLQSVGDEWYADYPNLVDAAKLFLGGMPDTLQASRLLEGDRMVGCCLDLIMRVPPLRSDALMKACDAFANGKGEAIDLLRASLIVFYQVGIVGIKLASTETYSWSADSGRIVEPPHVHLDTGIKVHEMFHSVLHTVVHKV